MTPQLADALRGFLETGDDVVEGALLAAQIVNSETDAHWARGELARIADSVNDPSPAGVVAKVAEHGFRGAGKRYYEVENSLLDHVLRCRRGIPITLGVVLMGVAGRLGLDALGVNFPRHFLITIGDVLVDPYAVAPTTIEICRVWLKENQVNEEGAFAVATPSDVVLRMLNNVRMLIHAQGDYAQALEISDYQLLIVPDAYSLYVERADAWLGLNAPEMVAAELEKAAERAPDDAIAARLRERIAQARRLKSVVN